MVTFVGLTFRNLTYPICIIQSKCRYQSLLSILGIPFQNLEVIGFSLIFNGDWDNLIRTLILTSSNLNLTISISNLSRTIVSNDNSVFQTIGLIICRRLTFLQIVGTWFHAWKRDFTVGVCRHFLTYLCIFIRSK
ncbi:Uncharacterised protein [Streptococcus suis]|uniref:Uncharacterized protein n=1 Tax=Streptococcus suis TaxID=1307 RepID=A0A0Z8JVI9_STRSU|nr:Uncharacterised protein [Streptococcus suis]